MQSRCDTCAIYMWYACTYTLHSMGMVYGCVSRQGTNLMQRVICIEAVVMSQAQQTDIIFAFSELGILHDVPHLQG